MAWNTTVRGRNLTKRQMTDEERKLYGLPLTGAEAARAEIAGRWEARISEVESDVEEWELEATPNR